MSHNDFHTELYLNIMTLRYCFYISNKSLKLDNNTVQNIDLTQMS